MPEIIVFNHLIHEYLETNGCILSTVVTDSLVLKHVITSIHIADHICIVLEQFHGRIVYNIWK